ncbi:hypothetical protein BY996DRAFT_6427180 [Phakopsora pachyrhizi]|nr:hypothetical protein BY996DRAFT_6427180 [Phakopsora pachyrhizi]
MNTSVIKPSRLLLLGLTDLTRWHLDSSAEGQVIWTYNSSPGRELGEQTFETKYWLSSHPKGPALPDPQGNPLKAAQNGFEFYKSFTALTAIGAGSMVAAMSQRQPLSQEVELFHCLANKQRQGSGVQDCGWGFTRRVVSYSNPHQRASVPDHNYEGRLGYWTVALTESRGVGRGGAFVGINIGIRKGCCVATLKKATYEVLVLNRLCLLYRQ